MGKPIGYHPARLQRAFRTIRTIRTIRTRAERRTGLIYHFLQKHFRFWQKNWHFSEKLQKNHQKIAFFAAWGVDIAKGIAYNTYGICYKFPDFTHISDSFTIEL